MTINRDPAIDILRGLAIFTMIAANLAAHALAQPHPLWLRFYGSFAAPLFIFISGMMIASTAQQKAHGLKYYLLRGAMVVAAGAFVDIFIWHIYPFMSVDVLYLIGISMPLAYLAFQMNTRSQWLITLLIFLTAPILRMIIGYTNYPTEIHLLKHQPNRITTAAIISRPLQVLGESTLFMYILHLFLIRYVIIPLLSEKNLSSFLLIYIILSSALIAIAYFLRDLKNQWKNKPFIIQFLLGG